MAFILFGNVSVTLLSLNSRGQLNQLYQYVNLCLHNSYIWNSNVNLYQNELKFLNIVYFEGTYFHLYKLLRERLLNLILLPTISHIDYWDQLNSWKIFWKFWNGPLCRNKSGPSSLLNVVVYLQSSSTEACAKKLSQILANNIDNERRGIGLRIYVRYCPKN